MIKRIITGIGIFCGVCILLALSDIFVYPVVLSLLSGIGVFEYLRVFSLVGKWQLFIPSALTALALPFVGFFVTDAVLGMLWVSGSLMMYLLVLLTFSVFFHHRITYQELTSVFTGTTYITLAFAALCILCNTTDAYAAVTILPVFIASWVTDTCAYFSGVLFGKHKLAPEISPRKTVEGSIGGVIGCILSFLVFGLLVGLMTDLTPHYLMLMVVALPLSVLSQVGDLVMSKVKREHGVKDFGKLFPGHGGVLDRFDSVLSVAPLHLLFALMTGSFALFG